jgi:predicted RNA-binding Zn ribbon-like protein
VQETLPRPDVPASIAVVRDFVNTTDRETGTDDLSTQADLVRHLTRDGLLTSTARATSADLALARRLRAGLRSALEGNHDGDVDPVPELVKALAELPVTLGWGAEGPRLTTTSGGVKGALARIGLAAHEAASTGTWWRLKICAYDECEWAYYDHSRNRSRSWCEHACGNLVKTRSYRARQRALADEAPQAKGAAAR